EETWHSYVVVNRYPHDNTAFTQGLVFSDGFLYEGTGLYGQSSLRKVGLEDAVVLECVGLETELFGEGIAILGDRLFQLTWKEGRGFVYDLASLERIAEFRYHSEGWGLTTDGKYLIMSDGSNVLAYFDPESYQPIKQLSVYGEGGPIRHLNELEYIGEEIFANVWLTQNIVRIDTQTGKVLGWIDLSDLHDLERSENPSVDVLNGIAYDAEDDRLFVTGKLWGSMYEIELEGF
ncbi:MAG TPA: glutamine cyclotransferase, partial [Firmicutes bacterium]|nr:glutamine cyclotransferase [Bacillota bacterium]